MEPGVGLIDAPLFTNGMPVNPGSLLEQWEKAPHPTVDRAAINDQPALGEPRDDIGVAEPVPDIPPHGKGDHIVREAVMRKGARRAGGEAPATAVAPPVRCEKSI